MQAPQDTQSISSTAQTEPEAIEQFSIRVADAWKLGRKGVDDGVLLLVARDNPSSLRRLRIEAGRGVQGVLTDQVAIDRQIDHALSGGWPLARVEAVMRAVLRGRP